MVSRSDRLVLPPDTRQWQERLDAWFPHGVVFRCPSGVGDSAPRLMALGSRAGQPPAGEQWVGWQSFDIPEKTWALLVSDVTVLQTEPVVVVRAHTEVGDFIWSSNVSDELRPLLDEARKTWPRCRVEAWF